MTDLKTASEAAAYLRVSRSLLYRLSAEGRIQHYEIASKKLYSTEQLDRFLASCARGGEAS